jgi:hypothetical protein
MASLSRPIKKWFAGDTDNTVKKKPSVTAKDSIGLTMDTAGSAGRSMGGGLKSSVSHLTGDEALKEWNKGIPDRFKKLEPVVREKLAKMPYPPVTD